MKERPILFSAPMVRALLAGTKTQTRRICKAAKLHDDGEDYRDSDGWPLYDASVDGCGDVRIASPYGQPSDRLWVRETFFAWGRWETRFSAKKGRDEWHFVDMTIECGKAYLYAAGDPRPQPLGGKRGSTVTPRWWKRPAIFMPRAASRIDLDVTGVRVEQLKDISAIDALQEGLEECHELPYRWEHPVCLQTAQRLYSELWEQINGAGSWAANPWVWVVAFRRISS